MYVPPAMLLQPRYLQAAYYRLAAVANATYAILVVFVLLGLVERLGYLVLRCHRSAWQEEEEDGLLVGRLPHDVPTLCTQLPMYNEAAVAVRSIDAACALDWPRDRYEVQVLDDSSDAALRAVIDATAAEWRARGVSCHVLRRPNRRGYKAGALEMGRRQTAAEYLALLDADFVPPVDFLRRVVPRFYTRQREARPELALVQAQWAHLNMNDSLLTLAQSLWIDDHHVSQMGWRSQVWGFVNFTGTAGVWRASAIETAGGWRAASLVEDCELSFRVLFCGYRTQFARVDVPAELPTSVTAYKAQQKRWTLGWAQLIRLHLGTLLLRHNCSCAKRLHLLYHMLLSIQWPLWLLWQVSAGHADPPRSLPPAHPPSHPFAHPSYHPLSHLPALPPTLLSPPSPALVRLPCTPPQASIASPPPESAPSPRRSSPPGSSPSKTLCLRRRPPRPPRPPPAMGARMRAGAASLGATRRRPCGTVLAPFAPSRPPSTSGRSRSIWQSPASLRQPSAQARQTR